MCNLNILIKKDKIRNKENLNITPSFLMATTSNSFIHNKDGEGAFFSKGILVKSLNKIDLYKYYDEIINSKFILTHQRLATSGFSQRYTHPFESQDFVLVHNGIINEFLGKNGSDTYGFFNKFINQFLKLEGNREENIIKVINNLLDNLENGSFSIALFDKKEEILYYFKNNCTNINLYRNSEFVYITTSEENDLFLKMFKTNFNEIKLKSNIIYKISVGKNIIINKVGNIKEVKQKGYGWGLDYYFQEGGKELKNSVICNDLLPCVECGKLTKNLNVLYNERICDECLKEFNYYNYKKNYPTYL